MSLLRLAILLLSFFVVRPFFRLWLRSCEITSPRKRAQKLFSISGPRSDYLGLGIDFVSPKKPSKTLTKGFLHSFKTKPEKVEHPTRKDKFKIGSASLGCPTRQITFGPSRRWFHYWTLALSLVHN